VAKANPVTGATFYVAEGDAVPDDLPDGVRPVGPGAEEPEPAEAVDVPELPPVRAPKADWVDHAEAAGLPRDEAEAMTKAELVEAAQAPPPPADSTPKLNSPASSAPGEAGQP
jgi:hypothetical protein